jgi:hypothetical protein
MFEGIKVYFRGLLKELFVESPSVSFFPLSSTSEALRLLSITGERVLNDRAERLNEHALNR